MEYNPNATVVSSAEETHNKKATAAMVLSIIGLALFILPGFNVVGLVLSIVGFVQSNKNRKFAAQNGFTENSMNTTGFVCGLIGIIIGGISVLFFLVIFSVVIAAIFSAAAFAAPHVGQIITESMPVISDAFESALPGAMGMIRAFIAAL